MSGKILLCRCEDVTLHDVEHAVAQGYRDLEEIKRYTGFGTGPCQGKECMAPVAIALARLTAAARAAGATDAPPPAPFTARPPIQPTPMRLLAVDPAAHRFADDAGDDDDDSDHQEGGP